MITHQITNSYGNYNNNAYIYRGVFIDAHFHGNYELIYAMEGTTEVVVNGVSEYLDPGEQLLICPYCVHTLRIDSSARAWVGVFSEDFITSFDKDNRNTRYSKFRCDASIEEILTETLYVVDLLRRYLHTACLYLVCDQCVENAVVIGGEKDDGFVRKIVEYTAEHIGENISMKEMAQMLNYEYHYFSALFHQHMGMNFKNFVNLFRFESACKLLSERNRSIADVGICCGFGSIRNFNRVFKSICGYTPGQYRKQTDSQ